MREAPLWIVSVGPPGAEPERVEDGRVTSLSYEDDESKADKLILSVDNYDLTQRQLPRWRKGNIVYAQWGYPGRLSTPRQGIIQKRDGGLLLKIEAQGAEVKLNRKPKVRQFEHVRRSDVAKMIAEEYGYTGELVHVDDTQVVLPQVTQGKLTDLQLLRDMAMREGFQFYIDHDGFHFQRRRLAQAPIRRFIYFTDPGAGDILAFNIEEDVSPGKAGAVTVAGRDPLKKEDFEVRADRNTESARPTLGAVVELVEDIDPKTATTDLGVNVNVGALVNVAQEAILPSTEPTKEGAARQASGLFANQQLGAIKLNFTAVGDPSFSAKSVAEVLGIGEGESGHYYATNVKHDLKDDYKMVVKARRDAKGGGGGSTGGTAGVPANGVENVKKAPEDGTSKLTEVEMIDPTTQTTTGTAFVDTGGKGK